MNIKDLKFDEVMEEFIEDSEEVFNEVAKQEGDTTVSMIQWIEDNIKETSETGILDKLTDREKFLFAFGALTGVITERYMED